MHHWAVRHEHEVILHCMTCFSFQGRKKTAHVCQLCTASDILCAMLSLHCTMSFCVSQILAIAMNAACANVLQLLSKPKYEHGCAF